MRWDSSPDHWPQGKENLTRPQAKPIRRGMAQAESIDDDHAEYQCEANTAAGRRDKEIVSGGRVDM
jgi:hypothetical protein